MAAAFSPTSVAGSGSSIMTLTTTGVAAGTYPLTITGTSGSLSHTAAVTVAVTDFSVSAGPPSQSVAAGSNAAYTVTVSAVNGFSGSVGLAVTGLPAGVTAAFAPSSVTGSGSSIMTLTTTSATAAGNYPLTITGTSGGVSRTASVTLTVTVTPDFSVSASPASQTVISGGSAPYTITVSPINGFSGTVGFSVSGLPAGAAAAFSPTSVTGSGSSTLTVTTTTATPAGSYPLTVTGTSGSLSRTANTTLVVTAPVGSGTLTGSSATPSGTIQLTPEGTSDWAHWGLNAATDFNHKAGVTPLISNYAVVGAGTPARYANNSVGFTWTDGTPAASATASTTGIYISGQGQGFRITAPAGTTARTLKVYVGAWRAQARMVAHLSDGSSVDYTDGTLTNSAGVTTLRVYTFSYSAASSAQTLTVTLTAEVSGGSGNVTLQAATLQ
jgi:hypothetical protein